LDARPSDSALVALARSGDRRATEALFRRHAERMNVLAFRLLGRNADVDDLVQETFARALTSLDALRDPAAFAGWIQGILVRTSLAWIRRRRIFARLGFGRDALRVDLDEVTSRVASPEKQLELRRAYVAIEAMRPEVRVALVLHRIDGMSLEDVARTMKLSLATVKRRIAEGQLALAEVLEGT
jgi:RNA polymerase sigma-70 factor (ECF subfamily)